MAASYDQKWSELAPINSVLHLLTAAVLAKLPADARILRVGAGTGTESDPISTGGNGGNGGKPIYETHESQKQEGVEESREVTGLLEGSGVL